MVAESQLQTYSHMSRMNLIILLRNPHHLRGFQPCSINNLKLWCSYFRRDSLQMRLVPQLLDKEWLVRGIQTKTRILFSQVVSQVQCIEVCTIITYLSLLTTSPGATRTAITKQERPILPVQMILQWICMLTALTKILCTKYLMKKRMQL